MGQKIELNEDTIIHIVRTLNQRGVSAQEAVVEGKVSGLDVTRGGETSRVLFGDSVMFGEDERDISFISKSSAPAAVNTEEAAPE